MRNLKNSMSPEHTPSEIYGSEADGKFTGGKGVRGGFMRN